MKLLVETSASEQAEDHLDVVLPALLKSRRTGNIILATGRGGGHLSGFVIHRGGSFAGFGTYGDGFPEDDFYVFKGSITISQHEEAEE